MLPTTNYELTNASNTPLFLQLNIKGG